MLIDNPPNPRPLDSVDAAGRDSFPASDPSPATPGPAAPPHSPQAVDQDRPVPPLVEVHEHPISNPATQSD